MRIALVNPPNIEHTGTFRPPINLAILAAYVRQHGHEVRIYDFEQEGEDDAQALTNILMNYKPDVIGFTCLTPRYPIIAKISKFCKMISKDIIILLGGPHVAGDPESVFYDSAIDYAIIGEGEEALVDFLNYLKNGQDVRSIPNLAYRQDNSIQTNPTRPFIKDLEALPFPAWDLLNIKAYVDPAMFKSNYMGIISARGCAWDCIFCASKVVWKRIVRMRSAENLLEEIRILINKYGISEFMFYDDTFSIDRKRTLKICELIKQEHLKIRFYVSLRADTIDKEIAEALKEAGCLVVFIGVESGDDKILKMTGKGITKNQIRQTVKALKAADLPILASFILGLPGDTRKTIQATINFAKELNTEQVRFLIAVPYPGTRLYDLALKKGILQKPDPMKLGDYSYYQHVAVNFSEVSDEELMQYQKQAYEEYDLIKRPIAN